MSTTPQTLSDDEIDALWGTIEDMYSGSGGIARRRYFARALLAQRDQGGEAVAETVDVADRYAHQLAMWLELILFDYGGKYYNGALDALGKYRAEMNAIHEQESPTHMGEPVIPAPKEAPAQSEREPSTGLLVSMAIRYDHGLGMPGFYDSDFLRKEGDPSHQQRLESTLRTMRQLWEEVSGNGFYRPEKEAHYAALASGQQGGAT